MLKNVLFCMFFPVVLLYNTAHYAQALPSAGHAEEIAAGLEFTEGPVWHPDGYLLFSDIPANTIYKWVPGKKEEVFRKPSGNSNGLTFDRQGRLILCEQGNRRVSRIEKIGTMTILADRYQGKKLNSPNDVAVRSDGSIYFTDPPYGLKGRKKELGFNGVYRISADGKLVLLTKEFDRPNGLAFSPDEKVLYIADSKRIHVKAFNVKADGTLGKSRVFADLKSEQRGGPDGMKVDVKGNLYVTGPGGVWRFDRTGSHTGVIKTGMRPTNCAFGGEGNKTLYITARSAVYRVLVTVPGIKVF